MECEPPAAAGVGLNVSLWLAGEQVAHAPSNVSYKLPELYTAGFGLPELLQRGGQRLLLQGGLLGPVPSNPTHTAIPPKLKVFIGDRECTNVNQGMEDHGQQSLACDTPPGLDAHLPVSLFAGGQLARCVDNGGQRGCTISYALPQLVLARVEQMTLRSALLSVSGDAPHSPRNESLTLCGLNLGTSAGDIADGNVDVGGQPCRILVNESDADVACIHCCDLQSTSWSSNEVQASVRLGNQVAATPLQVWPRPVVMSVTPNLAEPFTYVTIKGSHFGRVADDIISVTIGGHPCNNTDLPLLVPPNLLMCRVPLGSGTGLPVSVTRAGSQSVTSSLATFSYRTMVTSITAAAAGGVALPGNSLLAEASAQSNQAYDLDIAGSALGGGQHDMTPQSITIAGARCASVQWVSHQLVRCLGLRASDLPSEARPTALYPVQFTTTSGANITSAPLLSIMGAPYVSSALPLFVSLGDQVSITGHNFGRSAADLVAVFANDQPCSKAEWLQSGLVVCTLPTSGGVLGQAELLLRVLTASGATSSQAVSVHVSEGKVPQFVPSAIRVQRNPIDQRILKVAFTFNMTGNQPNSFKFQTAAQARPGDAAVEPSSQSFAFRDGCVWGTQLDAATELATCEFDLAGQSLSPLYVRVAAIAGFDGAFSEWVGPVFEICMDSQYLDSQAPVWADRRCTDCPAGAQCGGRDVSLIRPRAGFYRLDAAPSSLVGASLGTGTFVSCPVPSACPGSVVADGSDNTTSVDSLQCAPGHTGRLCASCAAGFAPDSGGACQQCDGQGSAILVFVGTLVAGLFVLSYLVWSAQSTSQNFTVVSLQKIVMGHVQAVSIMALFDLQWPPAIHGMLGAFSTLTSAGDALISPHCLMPSQAGAAYRVRTALIMLTPPLLVAVLALYWLVFNYFFDTTRRFSSGLQSVGRSLSRNSASGKSLASSADSSGGALSGARLRPAAEAVPRPGAATSRVWDSRWAASVRGLVVSCLVLMFLLHTSLSKTALQLFTCVELDDSGRRFLVQDVDVECSDAAHVGWMYGVGVPALLLYGAGIPLLSLILLYVHRTQLSDSDTQRTYGFLYAGYTRSTYFWETCIMLRKIGFAVVTVFLAPLGLRLQVYSVLVVALLALLAHDNVRPYAQGMANVADQGSLIVTILTMLGGLYLGEDSLSAPARTTVTVCVVGANVLFLVLLLAVIGKARLQDVRLRRVQLKQKQGMGEEKPAPAIEVLPSAQLKQQPAGTMSHRAAQMALAARKGGVLPSGVPPKVKPVQRNSVLRGLSPQMVRRSQPPHPAAGLAASRTHALHKPQSLTLESQGKQWQANPLQTRR